MGSVFLPLLAAPVDEARRRILLCRRHDRHRSDLELVESRSQTHACHLEPLFGRTDEAGIRSKRLHYFKKTRFFRSLRAPAKAHRLRLGS